MSLSIQGLVVCCICSDGKLRAVKFEGKQAKQVKGYLTHIQGGTLKLVTQPLVLMTEGTAVEAQKEPLPC